MATLTTKEDFEVEIEKLKTTAILLKESSEQSKDISDVKETRNAFRNLINMRRRYCMFRMGIK
jgi:hypothetical protein